MRLIRNMRDISAFGAALSFALCWAQVTIVPPAPQAQETVRAQVSAAQFGNDWGFEAISMSGNRITITVVIDGISSGTPIPDGDFVLGQFPAGNYDVEVVKHSTSGSPLAPVGTASFSVAAPVRGTRPFPLANYSDLWWNPAESGWGIGIHQHISDVIFATWFVYGSDGKPLWYVMPSGEWTSSWTYTGPIYRTTGPYFGGVFNPVGVTPMLVGSGTLLFLSFDQARFTYSVDGVQSQKEIQRQSF